MDFRKKLAVSLFLVVQGFSPSIFAESMDSDVFSDGYPSSREKTALYRNYDEEVTDAEFKDIRFILKALAQKSLISLWGSKSELESAGDRIDHIHPFRFLECIFGDDELIVYIQNIKGRGGWVWDEFASGLKSSLQKEWEEGNLSDEYFYDFISNVGIELNLVYNKFKKQDWESMVKILITNVQREGDPGKHDQ